jgi:hypothetical protein
MHSRLLQLSFRLLLPFVLVLLLVGVSFSLHHEPAQQLFATYTHGNLSVTVPYHSTREGAGRLTVEILDPEDCLLGRVERSVDIAKGEGFCQQTIARRSRFPLKTSSGSVFAIASSKYPIRAHTFQSRVYEYYAPDVNSIARPVRLEVSER